MMEKEREYILKSYGLCYWGFRKMLGPLLSQMPKKEETNSIPIYKTGPVKRKQNQEKMHEK